MPHGKRVISNPIDDGWIPAIAVLAGWLLAEEHSNKLLLRGESEREKQCFPREWEWKRETVRKMQRARFSTNTTEILAFILSSGDFPKLAGGESMETCLIFTDKNPMFLAYKDQLSIPHL